MKFLKHANCTYLLFSFLAATACVVCVAVAVDNGYDPLADYTTFFYSTSYGAFSAQYNKCQYVTIPNTTNTVSFDVTCPNGLINSSVSTSQVPVVLTSESLNSLFNCNQERLSLDKGQNLASQYATNTPVVVTNNNQATFSMIFTGLQPLANAVFIYECYDNTYNLGLISAKSDHFFYYVVCVDLAMTFFFLFFFCSEVKAEKHEKDFFKEN